MSSPLSPWLRRVEQNFEAAGPSNNFELVNLSDSCTTNQRHIHFWDYCPANIETDSDWDSTSSSWIEDSDVQSDILSTCSSQLSDSTSTEAPCVPSVSTAQVQGITQELNDYAGELEQRRKFAPVTASELSDIQEAREQILIDLRIVQRRVNETISMLTECQGLLGVAEGGGGSENGAERQRLKSSVRLLEMNLEEANTTLECEKRALNEISRRALDMQNEFDLQIKLRRHQEEDMGQHQKDREEAYDADRRDRQVLCSICMDEIVRESGDALALPCGHVFHEECVSAWLRRQERCPTCQMRVMWQI